MQVDEEWTRDDETAAAAPGMQFFLMLLIFAFKSKTVAAFLNDTI